MCNLRPEDCDHLFMGCVVANTIWISILQWSDVHVAVPSLDHDFSSWWASARDACHGRDTKRLDCLCVLGVWAIWRERNAWVFENKVTPIIQVVNQLKVVLGTGWDGSKF